MRTSLMLVMAMMLAALVFAPAAFAQDDNPTGDDLGGDDRGGERGFDDNPSGDDLRRVTHSVPQEWVYEGSPFTFVTDGVQSAIEQAKAVAGDKDVAVGAASIVQQCIKAGTLDEIHID
jgi:hypothetical protein